MRNAFRSLATALVVFAAMLLAPIANAAPNVAVIGWAYQNANYGGKSWAYTVTYNGNCDESGYTIHLAHVWSWDTGNQISSFRVNTQYFGACTRGNFYAAHAPYYGESVTLGLPTPSIPPHENDNVSVIHLYRSLPGGRSLVSGREK